MPWCPAPPPPGRASPGAQLGGNRQGGFLGAFLTPPHRGLSPAPDRCFRLRGVGKPVVKTGSVKIGSYLHFAARERRTSALKRPWPEPGRWGLAAGTGFRVLDSGLLDSAGPFSSPIRYLWGVFQPCDFKKKKKSKKFIEVPLNTQQVSLTSGAQVCDLDKCGQPCARTSTCRGRLLPSTRNVPGRPFLSAPSPAPGPGSCPSVFSPVAAV